MCVCTQLSRITHMPLVNIHCHVSHARYGPDRTLYSKVHFLNSISDEYNTLPKPVLFGIIPVADLR